VSKSPLGPEVRPGGENIPGWRVVPGRKVVKVSGPVGYIHPEVRMNVANRMPPPNNKILLLYIVVQRFKDGICHYRHLQSFIGNGQGEIAFKAIKPKTDFSSGSSGRASHSHLSVT
jgi:hypothetical protein